MNRRLPFVDALRGMAVVGMVLWHAAESWLTADLRQGELWALLRLGGGMAAPIFLFLAGMSAGLTPPGDDPGRALRNAAVRGTQVMLLGYALRFQNWLIDAGAISQLGTLRAWLPLGLGYGLWLWSTTASGRTSRYLRPAIGAGALLVVTGLVQVESVAAHRLGRLLQVDVLQAIGAALVVVALLQRAFRLHERAWLGALLGVAVATATPLVWKLPDGVVPGPLAGFLARLPAPEGGVIPGRFPLFPWLSYALIGSAMGGSLRRARDPIARALVFAVVGAAVAVVTSEAHGYMYRLLTDNPWLAQPMRVTFRLALASAGLYAGWWCTLWLPASQPLLALGRCSLRVYWVHLMFAYGVLAIPLKRALSLPQYAGYACALMIAMYGLTFLQPRRLQSRPSKRSPQFPAHNA